MTDVKMRQRTLLSGPGAAQVKLKDKQNRVHYVPISSATIEKIGDDTDTVVKHQCGQCGRTFSNEQGLGGHLLQ